MEVGYMPSGAGPLSEGDDHANASPCCLGAESTYACMRKLSSDWLYENRLYSMPEAIARVEQVTSEAVLRVVGRFPLREKQVLTTLGPLSERELLS